MRCVLCAHERGYAHGGLQPESFRLYDGTGWRLATLDGLTKLGQPTPAKCAVCYAAPEVRSCTCAGRSTRASTRATAVVS